MLENSVRVAFNENKNKNSEIQLNSHIYSVFFVPIEGTEYVNIYIMDISDRKRTEQTLKESEEKYRLLIETAEMGLVEFDAIRNNVSYINPKLLEILGYTRKDIFDEKYLWKSSIPKTLKN